MLPVIFTFPLAVSPTIRSVIYRIQVVVSAQTSCMVSVYSQRDNIDVQIVAGSSPVTTVVRPNKDVCTGRHTDLHDDIITAQHVK